MLKPLLSFALVVSMWALYLAGQARGGELGMAYAREEATVYQQIIEQKNSVIDEAYRDALYWKRSFEKLLSGPGTTVFDCFAVDN